MERNKKAGSKLDTRWPLWVIWPVDTSCVDAYAQPRGPEIAEPLIPEALDHLLKTSSLFGVAPEGDVIDPNFIEGLAPTADYYWNPDEVA